MKSITDELFNPKNRALLRAIEEPAAVKWNTTRWISTYETLKRYARIHGSLLQSPLTPAALKHSLLSNFQILQLEELNKNLEFVQSSAYYLQRDDCNLEVARELFDEINSRFEHVPGVTDYLAINGSLVNNPQFEAALVKAIRNPTALSSHEKLLLKNVFKQSAENNDPNENKSSAEAFVSKTLSNRNNKKRTFEAIERIPASGAVIERLFSKAKLIFSCHRQAMTPFHLELVLFLKTNRSLWSWEDLM